MAMYRWYLTAVTASAAAALAACSSKSSTPTTPTSASVTEAVTSDVAAASASAVSSTVDGFAVANEQAGASAALPFRIAGLRLTAPSGQVSAQTGCTIGTTTQTVVSGTDTSHYTRTWEYFHAGTCENAYAAGTTDSIQFTVGDTTDFNSTNATTHSHHNSEHYAIGDTTGGGTALSTSSYRFWSGTDAVTDTTTITRTNYTVNYIWSSSDTLHNAVFPHPLGQDVYPIHGTWSRWVTGTAVYTGKVTGQANVSRHVTVSFGATSGTGLTQDTMKVYDGNSNALLSTCLVDLSSGASVGTCQ